MYVVVRESRTIYYLPFKFIVVT